MTNLARYEAAFRRIVLQLRPYLDDLVIIGGWVPYLYRRYGGLGTWATGISLTAEVDVLIDRPFPPAGRPTIPIITTGGTTDLEIWLPTLGAYVVNKASTYARRQAVQTEGNPKRVKDLLYLRDLMAAGVEVVEQIEADLAVIAGDQGEEQVRSAQSTLYLAIGGAYQRLLPEVARMLVERESALSVDAALADIRGHLTDLVEILRESSG